MGLEDGLAVRHTEEYGYGYKRARSRLFLRSEKRGCLPKPTLNLSSLKKSGHSNVVVFALVMI